MNSAHDLNDFEAAMNAYRNAVIQQALYTRSWTLTNALEAMNESSTVKAAWDRIIALSIQETDPDELGWEHPSIHG